MSVVEGQDSLTPELRELKARIEAVERQVQDLKGSTQEGFQQVERRAAERFELIQAQFQQVHGQFQEAERRAERRHDELSFLLRQGLEVKDLAERLAIVEEKLKEARH